MKTYFKTLFLLYALALLLLAPTAKVYPQSSEPVGRCEYKSTKESVHVFECAIRRPDGEVKNWTLDIPDAQYPPSWEQPDAKKIYLVGRGTDGNIYAMKTPPQEPKPFQHVPNLHEKCKESIYRGEECTGEVLRHPLDLGKRKP